MAYDPLARFRREPKQPEPEQSQAQAPNEHQALRAAIEALHEMPNFPLSGEYGSSKALIPVLETAYQNAERELGQQRGATPMTDAQIKGAVEHDMAIWEEVRQDWKDEPVMTDEETQKGASRWERAMQAIEDREKEKSKEQDIQPER